MVRRFGGTFGVGEVAVDVEEVGEFKIEVPASLSALCEMETEKEEISVKNGEEGKVVSRQVKKRKRTPAAVSEKEEDPPVGPSGPVVDAWAHEFLKEYINDIKKEQKEKEKAMFTLADLGALKPIFKKNSHVRPAYCLPLFNFMHSLSILCTKVNNGTKGKCSVWTTDNMRRLEIYEQMNIGDGDLKALYEKFKWSWIKIPADDAGAAKDALEKSKTSPRSFYVILRGVKEETFFDEVTGQKVTICKPILEYSSVH